MSRIRDISILSRSKKMTQKCQGQILAVWILATKLPNFDVNFAVDFWVDFILLFFPKKKGPKKTTKKKPQNSPRTLFGKFRLVQKPSLKKGLDCSSKPFIQNIGTAISSWFWFIWVFMLIVWAFWPPKRFKPQKRKKCKTSPSNKKAKICSGKRAWRRVYMYMYIYTYVYVCCWVKTLAKFRPWSFPKIGPNPKRTKIATFGFVWKLGALPPKSGDSLKPHIKIVVLGKTVW